MVHFQKSEIDLLNGSAGSWYFEENNEFLKRLRFYNALEQSIRALFVFCLLLFRRRTENPNYEFSFPCEYA